jgi:LDH2 family malate/lactate/ureidoglycolate dehydrogenase
VQPDEARARIAALGFSDADTDTLFRHYDDAERRGKLGHGYARIPWLEALPDLDPQARPERVLATDCFERWEGRGALGYLTLSAIVGAQLGQPPEHARVIAASRCFPTGMLGHYVRMLAEGGLIGLLTATSPSRLAHPEGGPPLVGTNPLAIGVPSSDGRPLVADVSPAKATFGEVLAGLASDEDIIPFGGDQSHKAFALAVGLQLVVDSLVEGYGAVLLVAQPRADPVPALRAAAAGLRLPGER